MIVEGVRVGMLTAIQKTGVSTSSGNLIWEFLCDCGNTVKVATSSIRNRVSCGCWRATRLKTHGGRRTKLYWVWQAMLDRCRNQNRRDFKWYGGKGVSVCEEWKSFEVFRDWALSAGYDVGVTIDRIDGNGNYEPSNCRFVGWSEQNFNKPPRWRHGTLCGYKNHKCRCAECRAANAAEGRRVRLKNKQKEAA